MSISWGWSSNPYENTGAYQRGLDDGRKECESLRADLAAAIEERDTYRRAWNRADEFLEATCEDADRYLYLRDRVPDEVLLQKGSAAGVWCDCESDNGELQLLTGEDLDRAIDLELAKEKK